MSPAPTRRASTNRGSAPLVKALSQLETLRFVQYDGEIPPATGLHRPRLTVEVELGSPAATRVLRIGYPTNDGHVFAAEGTSGSGPVFLLTGRGLGRLDRVRRAIQSPARQRLRARALSDRLRTRASSRAAICRDAPTVPTYCGSRHRSSTW